jgi:hypothetical protein
VTICNCSLFQIFSLYNNTNCHTLEQFNCLNRVYFEKVLSNDFMKVNCYPYCPSQCQTKVYKTQTTMNRISTEPYFDLIRKHTSFLSRYDNQTLSDESIKNNIVKVNIYYDSLSYTQITESAKMNKVSLLASIGKLFLQLLEVLLY